MTTQTPQATQTPGGTPQAAQTPGGTSQKQQALQTPQQAKLSQQPQKKALIIGGTSGIGLAIAQNLIEKGYHAVVCGRHAPAELAENKQATYHFCDLLDFDESLIKQLAADNTIECLMITAGHGRVADFEYLHPAEIHSLMSVNAEAPIRIISYFYDRIKSADRFYTGIMGSIAGLVSSPMFSVYAASKAALARFAESVNIELEAAGTTNRILHIAPGSIQGTRFNGADQNLAQLEGLAEDITQTLFAAEELYIPNAETYDAVRARYARDPHGFGMQSYAYKQQSGRAANEHKAVVGYLSGTFDLFHIGHLNLLKRAKQHCDYLIVAVHPSAAHKGKETFIPLDERKRMVAACQYVDRVVDSTPEDCDGWPLYHYHRLFVGSDYEGTERFARYEEYFKDKGVDIMYFPYTEGTSSTQLRVLIKARGKEDSESCKG